LALAESAGLPDLVGQHLSVHCSNPAAETVDVVAGTLAGAGSIDDLDVLWNGGMTRLFDGCGRPAAPGIASP
jgi:hypothetical protein